MRIQRSIIRTCALTLALSAVVALTALADKPLQVDEQIVLRIGSREMSRYILDKYYTRFANAERQKQADFPTREAKRSWLELFLAQQVIIAHAETQGYSHHPEVQRIVSTMERHMLTQREGPFYQSLYNQAPLSEDRQSQLYAERLIVRQLLMVHFSGETEAKAALGENFLALPPDEKRRRLAQCREDSKAVVYEGPIAWPFEPCGEIGDFLRTTVAGEWFQYREAPLGIYTGFVEKIETKPAPSVVIDQAQFALQIREVDKRKLQLQRRAELLATSAFQINELTLTRLAESLGNLSPSTAQIPADRIAPIAEMPLFAYNSGPERITVTVGAYGRHFNNLMIRRFPGTLPLLRLEAENMAVEALDFQAACARGIQNAPPFVQDRHGFHSMQMLDLFEKEKLLSAIRVAPEEIERYYHEHAAEFVRISRIRGRLFSFETKEQMDAWYRDRSEKANKRTMDLSLETPLPGFEPIHQDIMQGPIGMPWGPVKHEKGYAVFIKESDVATTPLPLRETSSLIQSKLLRRHLDEKELRLAAELSPQFKIEDRIDYENYGVTAEEVKAPWRP